MRPHGRGSQRSGNVQYVGPFDHSGEPKLVTFLATPKKEDLTIMRDLMATGKLKPDIDKRYGLSEVPEVMRYLEAVHARERGIMSLA